MNLPLSRVRHSQNEEVRERIYSDEEYSSLKESISSVLCHGSSWYGRIRNSRW